MGRHAERNNVVGLAVIFEVDRVVAFVTVEDEQSIYSLRTMLGRLVKMF